MWEISNSLQVVCFFRAIILGILLSLFYNIFSAFRKAGLNSNTAVFFQDVLFFITAAPAIFIFLLAATNGEVRLYVILGIIIGFFCFKLTVSKFFVFILSKIILAFLSLFLIIGKLLNKFFGAIGVGFGKFFEKIAIFSKKALNTLKKLLKKQ